MTIQRISSYSSSLTALNNIRTAREAAEALQEKMVSNKEVNKPEDDPIAMRQILDFNTKICKNTQYIKNIDYTTGQLDVASSTLQSIEDMLLEIKTLAQTHSSSVSTSAERAEAAQIVESYLEEIVAAANTKYLGKFVFGGTNTLSGSAADANPFNITEDAEGYIASVTRNSNGIDDLQYREMNQGVLMSANLSGSAPFMPNGEGGEGNIFQAIMDVRNHLLNNDLGALTNDADIVQDAVDQVVNQDALLGIRQNRLDAMKTQLQSSNITDKGLRSSIQDCDYSEILIQYNTAQSVLSATLSSSAQLLQLSLLSYL